MKVMSHIPLATNLVHNGDLVEATKVIQSALLKDRHGRGRGPLLLPPPTMRGQASEHRPDRRERRPLSQNLEMLQKLRPPHSRKPVSPDPIPAGATFSKHSFHSDAGSRTYKLYVPSTGAISARPLVIMLHGCTQGSDDFANGTDMNALAEEFNFLVAYPEQSTSSNKLKCWNWFSIKDQHRGGGEPKIIAGIVQKVVREKNVDPSRVYIAGFSAGGAMAVVMAATYPELFAAVGVHSGLPYKVASDVPSAFSAMQNGEGKLGETDNTLRLPPLIVFHGDCDQTVHPANGRRLFDEFRRSLVPHLDLAQLKETRHLTHTQTVCYSANEVPLAEHWAIHGGGHTWSGGKSTGTYTDSNGPRASRELIRFCLLR